MSDESMCSDVNLNDPPEFSYVLSTTYANQTTDSTCSIDNHSKPRFYTPKAHADLLDFMHENGLSGSKIWVENSHPHVWYMNHGSNIPFYPETLTTVNDITAVRVCQYRHNMANLYTLTDSSFYDDLIGYPNQSIAITSFSGAELQSKASTCARRGESYLTQGFIVKEDLVRISQDLNQFGADPFDYTLYLGYDEVSTSEGVKRFYYDGRFNETTPFNADKVGYSSGGVLENYNMFTGDLVVENIFNQDVKGFSFHLCSRPTNCSVDEIYTYYDLIDSTEWRIGIRS